MIKPHFTKRPYIVEKMKIFQGKKLEFDEEETVWDLEEKRTMKNRRLWLKSNIYKIKMKYKEKSRP